MKRWYAWMGLFLLVGEVLAQTAPVLDPKKFTDRRISIRQMRSNDPTCFVLLKNGQPQVVGRDYREIFFYAPPDSRGGVFHLEVEFGYWRPGDVLQVEDRCRGEQSAPMVVQDDFAYLTIPAGPGHNGNGLLPTSQEPPYAALSRPVSVGRCAPITLNAHVLFPVVIGIATDVGAERTTGAFRLNGQSLGTVPMHVYTSGDPTQFQWGDHGNLTADGYLRLETIPVFDGKSPFELEYTHNGMVDVTDFWMFLGGIGVKEIKNHSFQVIKRNYLGEFVEERYEGDFTQATFRITFTENQYQVWLNGQLISTLERFLIFYTEAGDLSNRDPLPYGSSVTFQPKTSGAQSVGVLIDGAVRVQQKLQITEPLGLQGNVQPVRCYGGSDGQVQLNTQGGLPPFTYTYQGQTQSSALFSGLSAGTATFGVTDASGCIAEVPLVVQSPPVLKLTAVDSVASACLGQNTGTVTLQAVGGQGGYQFRKIGEAWGTQATISSLGAGKQVFEVQDQQGCLATTEATVGYRSAWRVEAQAQAVTCHGTSTGRLEVQTLRPATGTPRYSLNQLDYQSSPIFSGLAAGTYQIWAEDAGCAYHLMSLTVVEPSPVQVQTISEVPVRCFGEANGRWEVRGLGGTGPYEFSIDENQYMPSSSFVWNNLAAGVYKLWVRDAQGCLVETLHTVAAPPQLSWSVMEKSDITCPGGNDGKIVAGASGGNGGFQFFLADQPSAEPEWRNLRAGVYTVRVADQKGCTEQVSVELLQAPAFQVSTTLLQGIACHGQATGALSLQSVGGTPPYEYSLGAPFQTSNTFGNLVEGSYPLQIRDARGCVFQAPENYVLTQPTPIQLKVTLQEVSCYGGQNGQILLEGLGGQGAFEYSSDGVLFQESGQFLDRPAGVSSFWVRDRAGCSVTQSITLTEPAPLRFQNWVKKEVSCFGGSDGFLAWEVAGGISPYGYAWENGTALSATPVVDTLREGTYRLKVQDARGCVLLSDPQVITQPSALEVNWTVISAVACFGGNDAVVELRASGGTSPYEFTRKGVAFSSNARFSSLSAGTFLFQTRDAQGCLREIEAQITQPTAYRLAVQEVVAATCFGEGSGQVALRHGGGTAPYQAWIGTDTLRVAEPRFTGLGAATYRVEGRDANGCRFAVESVNIGQPSPIQWQWQEVRPVDCETYTRGGVEVSASGSHGGFVFQLSGQDAQGRPYPTRISGEGRFDDLPTGEFQLRAIDMRGCTVTEPIRITAQNTPLRFTVQAIPPTTCLQADGQLVVNQISGGRGAYTILLNQNQIGTGTFTQLDAGVYQVTVVDSLCYARQEVRLEAPGTPRVTWDIRSIACETAVAQVGLNLPDGEDFDIQWPGQGFGKASTFLPLPPGISTVLVRSTATGCLARVALDILPQNKGNLNWVERTSILCHGQATGVLQVEGQGTVQYRLGNGPWGDQPRFSSLVAGPYQVFSKNTLGCLDSLTTTLSQPAALQLQTVLTTNLCYGDSTGLIQLISSGGVSPYQYRMAQAPWQDLPQFDRLLAGGYAVSVKDQHGCILEVGAEVTQPTPVQLRLVEAVPVRCFGESNAEVRLQGLGGTPNYAYRLAGGNWQTSDQLTGFSVGNYVFEVKDAHQCRQTLSVELNQPEPLQIAFTQQMAPRCFGSTDGMLAVEATGGNANFEYHVGDQRWQRLPQFTTLGQGRYTAFVRDGKGCLATTPTSVELIHPAPIRSVVNTQEPRCFGEANGRIDWTLSGGVGPYRLEVGDQLLGTQAERFVWEKVASGSYTYRVLDAQNCEYQETIGLTQPTVLALQSSLTPVLCFGGSTGQIALQGQGATPPYSFALQAGSTGEPTYQDNPSFSNLAAQAYVVWVRDAQGCVANQRLELPQPPPLQLRVMDVDSVRCFGESNGRITLVALGGVPTYSFALGTGGFQRESSFEKLPRGEYVFQVRDQNQCLTRLEKVFVLEPAVAQLTVLTQEDPRCVQETNGQITLHAQGGNGRWQFSRDQQPYQSGNRFANLGPGQYVFRAKDWKGCEAPLLTVGLNRPAPISGQVAFRTPTCVGDQDGTLTLQPAGGSGGYQWTVWPRDTTQTPLVGAQGTFLGLSAGLYRIQIRDQKGCEVNLSTRIPAPDPLQPPRLIPSGEDSLVVCAMQWVTLEAQNPGQRYFWSHNGQPLTASTSTLRIQEPGEYLVRVENASGCRVENSVWIQQRPATLEIDFLIPSEVWLGDTIVGLDITRPLPNEVVWSYPSQVQLLRDEDHRLITLPTAAGEFLYRLSVSDGTCWYEKERVVWVKERTVVVSEAPLIQSVQLRPNPSSGRFQLEVNLLRAAAVDIQAIRQVGGQIITQQQGAGKDRYSWDFDWQVPSGIYLWIIRAENEQQTHRFIIQR